MLHRLVRTAPAESDESVFAHRQLAELIAPRHPWRAALYARRVVALRPTDDRGWAILAFAQTLLENYRFAASAYARALSCSPKNPWYAHNLGHLLDVALDRPDEALPWLAAAFAAARDHVEVATSYAHALARAGDLSLAKRILTRAMRASGTGPTREQAALWRWFERGAPGPKRDLRDPRDPRAGSSPSHAPSRSFLPSLVPVDRPHAPDARVPSASIGGADDAGRLTSTLDRASAPPATTTTLREPRRRSRAGGQVEEILLRQVAHLPFDAGQRARARAFARELSSLVFDREVKPEAVAAAVAYCIVARDEIPLTQAEVAATFRVRVSAMRARYHQLRAILTRAEVREPDRREPESRVPDSRVPDSRVPLRASRAAVRPESPASPTSPARVVGRAVSRVIARARKAKK